MTKILPQLRRPKLSKKAQENMIKQKINYKRLTGIGRIGNYNFIGTSLSGLTQELKSKEGTHSFSSNIFSLINILERLIGLAIHY